MGVVEPTGTNPSLRPSNPRTRTDPLHARTPAEFTRTMRDYLARIGSPSYQELEYRSGGTVSAEVFRRMLESDRLPRYVMLMAFVTACVGENQAECQRWICAWRNLRREDGEQLLAS